MLSLTVRARGPAGSEPSRAAALLKSHKGAAAKLIMALASMPRSYTSDCSLRLIESRRRSLYKKTRLPAVDNKVTDIVYIPLILFFEGPLHSSVDSQEAPRGPLQLQR